MLTESTVSPRARIFKSFLFRKVLVFGQDMSKPGLEVIQFGWTVSKERHSKKILAMWSALKENSLGFRLYRIS